MNHVRVAAVANSSSAMDDRIEQSSWNLPTSSHAEQVHLLLTFSFAATSRLGFEGKSTT
jgi:hypothetical protein